MKLLLGLIVLIRAAASQELTHTCGNYPASAYGLECLLTSSADGGDAIEIVDESTDILHVAFGNSITEEEFATYPQEVGNWSKNSPRDAQFDGCILKSPLTPIDCSGMEECLAVKEVPEFNNSLWMETTQFACRGWYPSGKVDDIDLQPPPEGQILTDEWGNEYILHATVQEGKDGIADSLEGQVLPEGWSIREVTLTSPFSIWPDISDDGTCYYQILRDNLDNSYHGIGCGGDMRPTDFIDTCPDAVKSSSGAATEETSDTANPETESGGDMDTGNEETTETSEAAPSANETGTSDAAAAGTSEANFGAPHSLSIIGLVGLLGIFMST
ncbi:unknown protein [Seminavis robusta]|uniref:Uncharacterized protein n=1 Tax=Seminavis robusta TaxID=568900 RepID=A0A9N8HK45_9STRA|nr:unknown protein [Seminavis robusta]|eukprot:Sro592_g172140.1 n/a (329) ;mRNA; r:32392-33438